MAPRPTAVSSCGPAASCGPRLLPRAALRHVVRFIPEIPPRLHRNRSDAAPVHMGPSRRLLPLCGSSRLMVVTGSAHVGGVGAQLPELSEANLLAEPSPKESMAAIGLAAAVFKRRDPEAVLGSFAVDYIISGRDASEGAVAEAVETAKAGYLVTIGIAPSHPSTGFGYIKLGEKLNLGAAPNARRASTAGTEACSSSKPRPSSVQQSMPALYEGLDQIAAAWDTPQRAAVLSEIWPKLDKIAIDHAVAEPAAKAGRVAVVSATFGWDDVEDFASLADLLPSEKGEACILGDPRLVVTESQAGGLIVPAAVRPRASLGVDDVVIVDTPDALLVTTRARTLARGQEDRGLPRAGLLPRAAYACCLACLVRPTPAASCGPRLPRAESDWSRSRSGVGLESDWSRSRIGVEGVEVESDWSRTLTHSSVCVARFLQV
ncbi:unnamed protein product [Tilletia controversa]|nr:unnamed protein product [Tilletia controversa]